MTTPAAPFVAGQVGIAGWAYLAFMGLYVPYKAWASRAKLTGGTTLPPRERHFVAVIFSQLLLLAVGLAVSTLSWIRLYPPVAPKPADLLAGAVVLALLIGFMVPRWRLAVKKTDRRLYFFMPTGAKEKALWVGVSLLAGFGEESIYRGVLFALLVTVTGNLWIAALGAALIFAAGHAFQSRRSMAIIFVFSLVFQALTIATGTLYVAMVVHCLYDVVAGFTYAYFGRTMGYRPEVVAEPAPAAAPGA